MEKSKGCQCKPPVGWTFNKRAVGCFLLFAINYLLLAKNVSAEETFFIHSDHLGSTTLITKDGEVVEKSLYYPYGSTRTPFTEHSSLITEKTYTGQISDILDTNLMYYNARYYNPTIAKFTQADSMGDGLNKYAYVHNNPIVMTDPTGNYGGSVGGIPIAPIGVGNIISEGYGTKGSGGKGCIGLACFEEKEKSGEAVFEQKKDEFENIELQLEKYGVILAGESWSQEQLTIVYLAVRDIAYRLSVQTGNKYTPEEIFKLIYGGDKSFIINNTTNRGNNPSGYQSGVNSIQIDFGNNSVNNLQRLVVHELGHVFHLVIRDRYLEGNFSQTPYNLMATELKSNSFFLHSSGAYGGDFMDWYWNKSETAQEIFADAYLGWVYNHWSESNAGYEVSDWMNTNMGIWLNWVIE